MASKTLPDDVPPLPAGVYASGPIDLALREGYEPLVTLRVAARVQNRVLFLNRQINTVLSTLGKAGTLPPHKTTVPVFWSKVKVKFVPVKDYKGEFIVDKGYPDFRADAEAKTNPDLPGECLQNLYEELAAVAQDSVVIGERLDALLRHHAGVPDADEVPHWSAAVTSGPMGWRLEVRPERSFDIDFYSDQESEPA